jgi:hypothetical protein
MAPVAAACSFRNVSRLFAARSSSRCSLISRVCATSWLRATSSRDVLPIASPERTACRRLRPSERNRPGHARRR